MPRMILDSAICNDSWLPAQSDAGYAQNRIQTLAQWLDPEQPAARAVQLEPGDDCRVLFPQLEQLELIVINFPVFTDGRGFSYARQLREQGFQGQLRAAGDFLPDQMHYLRRCGFNAFMLADEGKLAASLERLKVFSEGYQGSVDQPLPLFRRRA